MARPQCETPLVSIHFVQPVHRIQAHNDLSCSGALEQMGQISLQENPFISL
jgi:hypothetical protein